MLNTLTGGCTLPREILRWLDSLDLSYTIRNPRIDLANGFLVAEILSRHYEKDVNIYTYYNNQAKDKRINNLGTNTERQNLLTNLHWFMLSFFFSYISVLLKRNFILSKEEYEAISNLAPDTALDFIYRLYELTTKRKVKNDNRTIEINDQVPLYAKPTASYLAKDRQLGIIVNQNHKQAKTKKAIEQHLRSIKNKKYTTGLIEWLIAKRKAEISEEVRRQQELLNKKTRSIGIQPRGEVKQIQLKCFDESNQRNLGKSKNKSVIDFILDSFFIYLKKDFVIRDIHRLGLELKQKDSVNVLQQIFKRCGEQQEERRKVSSTTLQYLLRQLSEPAEISLVFENIHNNFVDFKQYFNLFIPALKCFNEEDEIYKLIRELIFKMSLKLIQYDSDVTEMMFVELELESYLSVSKQNPTKTRSICEIILSFARPTTLNQYEMITRVKDYLEEPADFIHYLSYFISIILVVTGEIQENLWEESYECAITGLESASPITRTSSAKIISELVIFADEGFFENLQPLTRLVEDDWWEVRALALVIYSRLLISKKKVLSDKQLSVEQKENKIDYESAFKQILISILSIFHVGADDRILRIGLVELAELLNYQPTLCSRYLQVLLHVDEGVLSDLLNRTENRIGCVSDSKNTFQYRLTGAASEWDPLGLVIALYDNFKQSESDSFEEKHFQILQSCVQRNLEAKNPELWLEIYNKLLPHLIEALKVKQTCIISSNVFEVFFKIQSIHKDILENSRQQLNKLLDEVYKGSNLVIHTTVLSLLKDLSEYNDEYMEYVYQTIKQFSEFSKDRYLKSNLVGFMNDLAKRRRSKIIEQ